MAATTIFLGAASNTVVKGAMAAAIGGRPFGARVLAGLGAMLLCGAGGVALAWAL